MLETMRPGEVAEELKTNPNTLRKQRQFAKLYSISEFNELGRLRRSDGMPLHWGHVVFLITVSKKKNRRRLQRQAVAEDWSAAQLLQMIRNERNPKTGSGGRKIKKPSTAAGQLRQMHEETKMWLRRCEEVWAAEGGILKAGADHGDMSELRIELRELLSRMKVLACAAAKQLKEG